MKIYKKYLIKNLFKHFLLILFILTTIIWTTRIIRYISYITDYGVDLIGFIRIIISVLPNLLLITIPISAFITIIFCYNKLIKNNELIILQNSGLKLFDMITPPLIMSFFLCAFSFLVILYFLPKSNVEFENIKVYLRNSITNILLNKTNSFNNFDNITIFSKKSNGNTLYSLLIYIKDPDGKIDKILYAKNGILNGNYITLLDGNLQEFKTDNKKDLKLLFFEKYTIDISKYYNINDIKNSIDEDTMFLSELLKIKDKNQKIKAEILERITNPFISIVLVLFSSILVLNLNFSRMENNKELFKIYLLNIADFSLFLYSFKILKNNINGIYITLCSFIIPFLWCWFFLIYKKVFK